MAVALVANILGGVLLAVILTSQDVLPRGTDGPLVELANRIADRPTLPPFLSALIAGALMTVMTWFVEGAADSLGVRIVMAWLVGFVIALGAFNHAIVSTIELVFGMRFVTFVRSVQAAEGARA